MHTFGKKSKAVQHFTSPTSWHTSCAKCPGRVRHVLSRPDRPTPATEREGGADWRRGRRLLPQRAPTFQDRRGDQQEGPRDHHVSRGAREAETRLRDIRYAYCVLKNIYLFCTRLFSAQYIKMMMNKHHAFGLLKDLYTRDLCRVSPRKLAYFSRGRPPLAAVQT